MEASLDLVRSRSSRSCVRRNATCEFSADTTAAEGGGGSVEAAPRITLLVLPPHGARWRSFEYPINYKTYDYNLHFKMTRKNHDSIMLYLR
jgi:hypothetical protein